MAAGLWVREGASRGTWFVLPDAEVVIGRDLDVDLPVCDVEASRRHACLRPDSDGWTIRDLDSRNGTRVNGVPERGCRLQDGDHLTIGRTRLVFRLRMPPLGAADAVVVTPGGSTLTGADTPGAAHLRAALPAATGQLPATDAPPPADLLGDSPAMREIYTWIRRAAAVDSPVLVHGETGTGKELIARALHACGPRRAAPFVALHCAAVPAELFESELFGHARGAFTGAHTARKGLIELAHGGTLMLDEIGDCPPAAQVKLLRVLECREVLPVGADRPLSVDFRLVSATHRDLAALSAEGGFRSDLYYRLRVLEVDLPALRERAGDIRLLAESFLDDFRTHNPAVRGISAGALAVLDRYRWPGNVRELRNAMERAVLVSAGPQIEAEDLPLEIRSGVAPTDSSADATLLREVERRHILRVLRLAGGNKSRAAAMLGVDRGTLYNKLHDYGVS